MTTKTNKLFLEASELLKKFSSWVIFTHKKADGDAIGSACALIEVGINSGKNIKWYCPDSQAPKAYEFLDALKYFTPFEKNFEFNDSNVLYVFLDCANEYRSVQGFPSDAESREKINVLNVDHHEDNSLFGNVNCVDGKSSSTCEMLFNVFSFGNWTLNKKIAECLYTGIYTDTGGFAFSSTSPETHKIAAHLIELGIDSGTMTDLITQNKTLQSFLLWSRALQRVKVFGLNNVFAISWLGLKDFQETGAASTETEGLPNMLMTLSSVKMIVLVTESKPNLIRASFRSRPGLNFTAGEVARTFGGGGHELAAGATLNQNNESLEECVKNIEILLLQKLKWLV